MNIGDNPLKLTYAERNIWETINKLLNVLTKIFPNLHEQEGFQILLKKWIQQGKSEIPSNSFFLERKLQP